MTNHPYKRVVVGAHDSFLISMPAIISPERLKKDMYQMIAFE